MITQFVFFVVQFGKMRTQFVSDSHTQFVSALFCEHGIIKIFLENSSKWEFTENEKEMATNRKETRVSMKVTGNKRKGK